MRHFWHVEPSNKVRALRRLLRLLFRLEGLYLELQHDWDIKHSVNEKAHVGSRLSFFYLLEHQLLTRYPHARLQQDQAIESANRKRTTHCPAEVFLSNFFRLLYCLDGSYLVLKHTVTSTIKSMYWTSGPPRFSALSKTRAPVAARIGRGIAVQAS